MPYDSQQRHYCRLQSSHVNFERIVRFSSVRLTLQANSVSEGLAVTRAKKVSFSMRRPN